MLDDYENNIITLKQKTEDSGWIEATLTSKFKDYQNNINNHPRYRKIGNIVEVIGQVSPTETIEGGISLNTIFTLPNGYRPNKLIVDIMQGSALCHYCLRVETNGNVMMSRYIDLTKGAYVNCDETTWLPFHAMFFAD